VEAVVEAIIDLVDAILVAVVEDEINFPDDGAPLIVRSFFCHNSTPTCDVTR